MLAARTDDECGAPDSESDAKCSACGTEFTSSSWTRLDLSMLIASREIRELVLGWPDDVCVEVRVCSRCQREIAMKRRTSSIG
jgi:DNA-directed RNA polymerase subunit RPC12/RpoP